VPVCPEQVQMLGGTTQHLALRDTSVDVAWLSAVIHHLSDLLRCVGELRRVLTGDGVVLAVIGHPVLSTGSFV
jgi:ubiquinone/menaquinone biosynthesis C-methylase UbiE